MWLKLSNSLLVLKKRSYPSVKTHPQLNKRCKTTITQSAWVVEYTDSFSAEGYDSNPTNYVGYQTKQSDEVPVMLELWGVPLHCHRSPVHSGSE